jgi:signal transduction histidine kinase
LPANLLGFLFSLALFVVFSLFPSGYFAPRWIRWLIPAFLLNNFLYQFFTDWYAHLPGWARLAGLLDFFGSLLLLVLAQMYRYWHLSTPVQRQQTKWILFSLTLGIASMLGWSFLENFIPSLNGSLYDPVNAYLNDLGSLLFPISFAIAIMRYRLWDIDAIINRTLVYGALTASVAGLYIFVVGYLGALFRTGGNLLISLLATGLVAVLFQPLRGWLQRSVNRLIYGQRDEPYAVVARLGRRLESVLAPEAVLPTIVETVAQALKLPYVAITWQQDGVVVIAATFGEAVDELLHLPLSYQSELIGELVLAPRGPGESFTPADRALLSDLARQAGVAAHAVRLTTDLQRLTGELQQSRTQLVSAREEERRRLRRDLHDGLGPQLASLTLKLETARNKLAHDPLADRLLAELTSRTQTAVADIRRLVYALRPPALDELGLLSALREQAFQYSQQGQSPLLITCQAPESLPPLPAAVEVAVYRIAQEALTNVVRHAQADQCHLRLILDAAAGVLSLEIQDNGCGLSPTHRSGVGLASMRERAEELGGTWTIESASTGGARILAQFPFLSPETGDSTDHQQLSLTEEEDEP